MSIGTYSELQSAVRAWMLRASTDLVATDAQIKNYIFLCEAELNRELKVRELEESYTLTTVAAQDYVTLPTDFKKVQDVYFDSAPYDLNMLSTKGELKRKWGVQSGRPVDYVIWGTKIFFGKLPDAVYTIPLDYYKAIPALTDSNTTNVILTAYPDLYLYGSLRHAYGQTKDKKNKDDATTDYVAAIDRIKLADRESRMPSNMRMQTRQRLM